VKGVGCPGCLTSGFRKSLAGYVYVARAENLTKVGVTNRTPTVRLAELSKRTGRRFETVASWWFSSGMRALSVEATILNYLRQNYAQVDGRHEGATETFIDVNVERLLEVLAGEVAHGGLAFAG
jgi:hypothetical protein